MSALPLTADPQKSIGVVDYVRTLTDAEKELAFEELLRHEISKSAGQDARPTRIQSVAEQEVAVIRDRIQAMLDRLTPEERSISEAVLADLDDTFDPLEWNKRISHQDPD